MRPIWYWLLRAKLAVVSVLNPWSTARQLREENARLTSALAEPFLTGLEIGAGRMDVGLTAPAAEMMAGMFLGMFEKTPDAKNYIECRFSSKMGEVLVTVVRPGGKTPGAMRREAEEKLAAVLKEQSSQDHQP